MHTLRSRSHVREAAVPLGAARALMVSRIEGIGKKVLRVQILYDAPAKDLVGVLAEVHLAHFLQVLRPMGNLLVAAVHPAFVLGC